MKKLLLAALLSITFLSCNNDDDNNAPVVQPEATVKCDQTVFHYGFGTDGAGQNPYYTIDYGADSSHLTTVFVDKPNYDFYVERYNAGNKCWIGLQ
ncbi:hypothetical protein FNO01nite_30310 [Flavobacterium noncentrifugens]|uniref:F5/8 type C domain-containing protein n=1 Tax=Flavobacterium noncentrifugens TaxID=1128970 RepID=A0A1G9BT96_9FLAO|nr:hypothetical protein [Flavobacterium noncentrifugens]GEP52359.1 hypothetical protein FNO01nite_30310 [Flavobacterium noncentrifugens]SDK42672.1 hypothetical protein SAMN04487935_3344 [Flavobacterium noncentrifugens]